MNRCSVPWGCDRPAVWPGDTCTKHYAEQILATKVLAGLLKADELTATVTLARLGPDALEQLLDALD